MVFLLKVRPERPFCTVFENDAVVWLGSDCSEEHDDAGMTDGLHCMAFAEKISQADFAVFDFKLFDNNSYFSPLCPINNSIATFADLALNLKLFPGDLNIRVKLSVLGNASNLEFRGSLNLFMFFAGQLTLL